MGTGSTDGRGVWARLACWLLCAAAAPLHGQSLSLDHCSRPAEPIGVISASGVLTYQLNAGGKPVAGTITARSAVGASRTGLQSAAARQLTACRFRVGDARVELPVVVEQEIRFDSVRVWFSDPVVARNQDRPVPGPVIPVPARSPVPDSLPAVDERPRAMKCRMPAAPRTSLRADMSGAELTQQLSLEQHLRYGYVALAFVIRADGAIDKSSVQVLGATNPLVRNRAVQLIRSCRFAPGRIGGFPVPVSTVQFFYLH